MEFPVVIHTFTLLMDGEIRVQRRKLQSFVNVRVHEVQLLMLKIFRLHVTFNSTPAGQKYGAI